MKSNKAPRNIIITMLFLLVLIQGCVVISFYPLYEKEDLFNNDLLTGEWMDGDSTQWSFVHPTKKVKGKKIVSDSAGYVLTLDYKTDIEDESKMEVNVIKLDGTYYLDFYLSEYEPRGDDDELYLYDLHVLPVHSFARMKYWEDSVLIEWMDPDWLEKKFKENKIRLRHEDNGSNILLTAPPKEVQKFLLKYGHEDDVFELDMTIYRKKSE